MKKKKAEANPHDQAIEGIKRVYMLSRRQYNDPIQRLTEIVETAKLFLPQP